MTWTFADGFDLYAAAADAVNGYWDSGTVGSSSFVAGRFIGSQAINWSGGTNLTKSSGVNDAVHHLVVAFRQTAAISGSTLGCYLELFDGATAQCTVSFRSDGAIVLTSGSSGGTVLATYTGAFSTSNVWYAFEFEIVINNSSGSFKVRKDGNTSNDFSATSLDTQNSANAYANKLQIGATSIASNFDDFFWRSDATSVAWLGDIRCYTRMPATDATAVFSHSPATLSYTLTVASIGIGIPANDARGFAFISPASGVAGGGAVAIASNATANFKCALYDATGSTLLATSNALTNPLAGSAAFTFVTPPTLVAGQTYYLVFDQDATITYNLSNTSSNNLVGTFATVTYASFPPTNLAAWTISTSVNVPSFAISFTTPSNSSYVRESQQDALATYVYDSTAGDADFYSIGSISSTPTSVIAVTTRAYMMKSDVGSRTAAVQLTSGATTVASPTITLSTSGWQWAWRTDVVDPNTSSAWTAAHVDSVAVGPVVIS